MRNIGTYIDIFDDLGKSVHNLKYRVVLTLREISGITGVFFFGEADLKVFTLISIYGNSSTEIQLSTCRDDMSSVMIRAKTEGLNNSDSVNMCSFEVNKVWFYVNVR